MEYSIAELDSSAFDPVEAARMLGLTPQQKKLADGILAGMNQTRAAIAAGYSGKHATATASKAAQSEKVKAYVAWARAGGHDIPDDEIDETGLRKILTRIAKGADKHAAIKATEALLRLNRLDREQEKLKPLDPVAILAQMLVVASRSVEYAATAYVRTLAEQHGVSWADVQARVPKSARLAPTATDIARGYPTEQSILDRAGNGLPRSSEPAVTPAQPADGGADDRPRAAPPSHDHRAEAPSYGLGSVRVFGD